MRSCINQLRTFCRPGVSPSPGAGFKKDVYSVTSVVSSSYVPEQYNKRILKSKKVQKLPFKVAKSGRLHLYFHELSKDYGSITRLKLLKRDVVVLNTADAVKKLFRLNDADGRSSPFFQHYVLQDKGFSFSDLTVVGEKQKQILKRYLHNQIEHSKNIVRGENDDVVKELLDADDTVNADRLIHLFLSNVFCRLLIGETLSADDPDRKSLWELIDHLYTLLDPSIDAPLRTLPFLRFMPGKYGNIYKETIKARDRVSRRYFDMQKSTYKEGRVRGLVDVCLKIQQDDIRTKGDSWLTDDYIKGLMYDTVAAGMSEMMKSIRMLILLMCHHQDIQSRVHAEIDAIIRTSFPVSTHRNKMPYTEAVLLEMLRYVSQTPLAIPHKCNKDVVLDGYLIEKNSGIFPNIWGIHHDESVWGDPWVFRPERFLKDDGKLLAQDHKLRRTLIPFSVGKRRCPGEEFAMSRLFLLFTSMLQQLEFLPPVGEELPSTDPRLYTNKYPLHLPVFRCRAVPRRG